MNKPSQSGDLARELDAWHMSRALRLAALGRGFVEPNPMVGCVVAHGAEIVGEGYHRRFGGPHAEVEALSLAGARAVGATLYVTLEPCCHFGKTPPCTRAIIAAGVRRVVVAMSDPFPQVAGRGLDELRAAGIAAEVGLQEVSARSLNAPYLKLLTTGRPWVIAKWAMTLDGKLAAAGGDSRWISNEQSRAIAHQLRGRVDAVIVGAGTARTDDPLLTTRPSGTRTALRVVADDLATLSLQSRLVQSARESPVLVFASNAAPSERAESLRGAGCEVEILPASGRRGRLVQMLESLGRRRATNVLVEGGATLLGEFFDADEIDEVHAFVAPKLIGGASAPWPIAGLGLANMADARRFTECAWQPLGDDLYFSARVNRRST